MVEITFCRNDERFRGEYLEFVRIENDTFRVSAFPVSRQPLQRLIVKDWIYHRTSNRIFDT